MKCFLPLLFCLSLLACSKEKRFSNRLMRGEQWFVKSVTVAGNTSLFSGSWYITSKVNIYDTIPSASWLNQGLDASFMWQFQEKGKQFELQYTPECLECSNNELDTLDKFVNSISGKYSVEKHGQKKMSFTSNSTKNWNGLEVKISLERK